MILEMQVLKEPISSFYCIRKTVETLRFKFLSYELTHEHGIVLIKFLFLAFRKNGVLSNKTKKLISFHL